ncbi:mitochondrial 54S ribosomal protein uL10m [Lodderomyces beijingensis]|uniref:Ribosomal protein L10 n=1 Tax=Lodderomyces beijingensis TaxID=1775926 RepID=A0ABP0ZTQ5_9ASCO
MLSIWRKYGIATAAAAAAAVGTVSRSTLVKTFTVHYSLSTSTETTTTTSIPAFIPTNEKQRAFLNRQTEKDLFSRKTYLLDLYKHMNDTNEIILYVHHNNLTKSENQHVREEIKKIGAVKNEQGLYVGGARYTMLKNSIYSLYLRSSHEVDPAAKGMTLKNKDRKHPLLPLLAGPTACITIPECEPSAISQVQKILKKMSDKLIIIGAQVEKSSVMNAAELNSFKNLPDKQGLQGQLLGLLTMSGGAGLVQTLETPGHLLYLTMDTRAKDLDPEAEK